MFTLGPTLGPISPDAMIAGVLVDLPNGLNDDAERTINDARETIATTTDPFQDKSLIPQLGDGEEVGVVRCDND